MQDSKIGDNPRNHPLTLTLDTDYYQQFLDCAEISEQQKQELIETIWNIVVQFNDMGGGVHPLQQSGLDMHEPEQIEQHPVIRKAIEESFNQNDGPIPHPETLTEAWPKKSHEEDRHDI